MAEFDMLLGIIIHIFTIIILVVGVIIGIKLIQVINHLNEVVNNVEEKVNSLNGLFKFINKAATSIDLIGDKIASTISSIGKKVFKGKKEDDSDE